MRLQEYWGVGPKTAALLEEELGVETAVEAIESADSRALVDAGLAPGRATRILRRANGGAGLDVLATGDAREVYRDLLTLAEGYAVTERAADRIRVLTPLTSREAIQRRLDDVQEATESWRALDDTTRGAVLDAFEEGESGELGAVETAIALAETGVDSGAFRPVAELDADALADAAVALRALRGDRLGEGADDSLDRLRGALGAIEDMAADPGDVLETVKSDARDASEFRDTFLRHVSGETGLPESELRESVAADAVDAEAFVTESLRALATDLRGRVDERERAVAERLRKTVDAERESVDRSVEVVEELAVRVSLARFTDAYDLVRPTLTDGDALAVRGARNLDLLETGESVQPIDYAVGDHSLEEVPDDDRVAVLTGANSGGKTTLLETLCQVQLLVLMGLPVPAEEADVGLVDSVVFHRRHASFNAGVLESTLQSVVPPVTREGRTLMLVDEFEAITEPGRAADLLHGLVTLTVEREALGAFVTHLAEDLEPLPDAARVDGIFAEGLTPELELEVDYQPRFGQLGKSTPEFIVSRLVAEASDKSERAGYEHLAGAVGQEMVQRTLADARWSE
ncbi:DNA mismatch repair protein [Halorarius halobius]|uniref:DNA mismatch repair protein n=1 Tax=Halorarius halobius TaxID=2962671 RepID=UPI0020CE0EE3|nr:DNA mismatch repair protein [Halorarius halobius]